jgi:hypothetical protein
MNTDGTSAAATAWIGRPPPATHSCACPTATRIEEQVLGAALNKGGNFIPDLDLTGFVFQRQRACAFLIIHGHYNAKR